MRLTLHYISSEWKLQSYVLATSAFPERHTAAEIAHKLVDITDDYKITSKVSHVVHDQGANMVAAMKILEVDKGWTSLRCTAHCLQLCVNAGLSADSKIEHMVAAAKKLVGHFKHSIVTSEALKQRQAQMGIEEKKLIQSCVTRWSSCYEMLTRLLEMRWPVSAVLGNETVTKRSDWYLDLKSEQWALAEEVCKVLEPSKVATTYLQYEHNASISCVLPIIHGLDRGLQPSLEDSPVLKTFKSVISQQIKARWSLEELDVGSIDVYAVILDPRFKVS